MTPVQTYPFESILFTKEDFQTLCDLLIDRAQVPGYYNPVVEFLAQHTGYEVAAVLNFFSYAQAFGRFNKMPFTNALVKSNPGPQFWWDLYALHDEHEAFESCKKMFEKVQPLC